MRKLKIVLFLLIVVILTLACSFGGGGGEEEAAAMDPVTTVESFMQAVSDQDFTSAAGYVCAAQQEEMLQAFDYSQMTQEMGIDVEEAAKAIQVQIDGQYELVSEDSDKAVVNMTGTMTINIDVEMLKDAMISSAGMEEAEAEMMTSILESMSGTATDMGDTDVVLIKEGSKWVICDE